MKKIKKIGLFLVICLLITSKGFASSNRKIVKRSFKCNGGYTNASVIIDDGSTMVAVGDLTFYMGLNQWGRVDEPGEYFGNDRENNYVGVFENSNRIIVNGKEDKLKKASFVHNGKTYVPLAEICEKLDYTAYWSKGNKTLYVQRNEVARELENIFKESLLEIQKKDKLETSLSNNIKINYYGRNYIMNQKGLIQADYKQGIGYSKSNGENYQENLYNKKKENINKMSYEFWVTKNGEYKKEKGKFIKTPVAKENLSLMNMATKSILMDYNMFLYSSTIAKDKNGDVLITSDSTLGKLLEIGVAAYNPKQLKDLPIRDSYVKTLYDKNTNLPKKMTVRLYSSIKENGEPIHYNYDMEYAFNFNPNFNLKLPAGVK